jgi:mannose-6-phosphate isomerase
MAAKNRHEIIDEASRSSTFMEDAMGIWVRKLHNYYPKDITQLAPAYLNLVKLSPGQALYFPAGVLHCYLHGEILELMANSDNVLRGGLTEKYVDLEALQNVVNFRHQPLDVMEPGRKYRTPANEFELHRMPSKERFTSMGDEIIICIRGQALIKAGEEFQIRQGESYFIPQNTEYLYAGHGLAYKATTPY